MRLKVGTLYRVKDSVMSACTENFEMIFPFVPEKYNIKKDEILLFLGEEAIEHSSPHGNHISSKEPWVIQRFVCLDQLKIIVCGQESVYYNGLWNYLELV